MKSAGLGRKVALVVAAVAMATVGVTTGASADVGVLALDHKDPYDTGCANTKSAVRTGTLTDRNGNPVGTIKLMWSTSCQTNWIEIWVPTTAYGNIWVRTSSKRDDFAFKAGNGGHHWGNMLVAPGVCAWGGATTSNPSSRGQTPSACG